MCPNFLNYFTVKILPGISHDVYYDDMCISNLIIIYIEIPSI